MDWCYWFLIVPFVFAKKWVTRKLTKSAKIIKNQCKEFSFAAKMLQLLMDVGVKKQWNLQKLNFHPIESLGLSLHSSL